MPGLEQRAAGAIVGSIVADAAASPIQWVYDAEKLNKDILAGREDPEFLPENHCPFFTIPTGKSTYYGEEVFVLLESLLEGQGWNKDIYRKKLFERFGPGTIYDHEAKGIDLTQKPVKAPWLSGILKAFNSHYQNKGEFYTKDPMIETASQVAPMVALYAGKPQLKVNLDELSRTLQDSDIAAEICVSVGLLVEKIILQAEPQADYFEAFKDAGKLTRDLVEEVKEKRASNTSCVDAVGEFGRHCGATACFKGGLYAISSGKDDFITSNRESLRAGGDVCGRGAWIGAALGARAGLQGLPEDWIKKTELAPKTIELAQKLVALRSKV